MSIFTNPSSRSSEQAHEYTAAILDLLGDEDPRGVLESMPGALQNAVHDLSTHEMSLPEAPGKWSIRQVVQHLADAELVWGYRLRLVLGQDRPVITGYDQDAWASRLHYDESSVAESIDLFTTVRRSNLRLIARATPEDLLRVGVHAERGDESIAHVIRLNAGHDLLHLRQIARIRRAVL